MAFWHRLDCHCVLKCVCVSVSVYQRVTFLAAPSLFQCYWYASAEWLTFTTTYVHLGCIGLGQCRERERKRNIYRSVISPNCLPWNAEVDQNLSMRSSRPLWQNFDKWQHFGEIPKQNLPFLFKLIMKVVGRFSKMLTTMPKYRQCQTIKQIYLWWDENRKQKNEEKYMFFCLFVWE